MDEMETWWVDHAYHRYMTTNKVDKIKIKFAI